MSDNKEYNVSFEFENITALTLDEFIEKVRTITNDGAEISNIAAVVVTKTISNPWKTSISVLVGLYL